MKHLIKAPQGDNRVAMLYGAAPECLSEQQLLAFHRYLFSPGFHCIKVPSVEAGRRLLHTYSSLCSHFVNTAFLSNLLIPGSYHNLYEDLSINESLKGKGTLEEFMLCSMNYELLIIEATSELLKTPWFGRFEQLLIDYDIAKEMTIIMFMY